VSESGTAARYRRNEQVGLIGVEGQARLRAAQALVVGAGGLGGAALYYLAGAGVGRLRILDGETVEESNLNRQILFRPGDVGRDKAAAAAAVLGAFNPDCAVEARRERLDAQNAAGWLAGCGAALDCSDNFAATFALADACWQAGVPLVTAGVVGLRGQLLVVDPAQDSPCYRCLLAAEPGAESAPRAATEGILGGAAGALGSLMAVEAVKALAGRPSALARGLLFMDLESGRVRVLDRRRRADCAGCVSRPAEAVGDQQREEQP
jgi:molybdopterin/thiamine biosynthesis adenylyltransferase